MSQVICGSCGVLIPENGFCSRCQMYPERTLPWEPATGRDGPLWMRLSVYWVCDECLNPISLVMEKTDRLEVCPFCLEIKKCPAFPLYKAVGFGVNFLFGTRGRETGPRERFTAHQRREWQDFGVTSDTGTLVLPGPGKGKWKVEVRTGMPVCRLCNEVLFPREVSAESGQTGYACHTCGHLQTTHEDDQGFVVLDTGIAQPGLRDMDPRGRAAAAREEKGSWVLVPQPESLLHLFPPGERFGEEPIEAEVLVEKVKNSYVRNLLISIGLVFAFFFIRYQITAILKDDDEKSDSGEELRWLNQRDPEQEARLREIEAYFEEQQQKLASQPVYGDVKLVFGECMIWLLPVSCQYDPGQGQVRIRMNFNWRLNSKVAWRSIQVSDFLFPDAGGGRNLDLWVSPTFHPEKGSEAAENDRCFERVAHYIFPECPSAVKWEKAPGHVLRQGIIDMECTGVRQGMSGDDSIPVHMSGRLHVNVCEETDPKENP